MAQILEMTNPAFFDYVDIVNIARNPGFGASAVQTMQLDSGSTRKYMRDTGLLSFRDTAISFDPNDVTHGLVLKHRLSREEGQAFSYRVVFYYDNNTTDSVGVIVQNTDREWNVHEYNVTLIYKEKIYIKDQLLIETNTHSYLGDTIPQEYFNEL